MIGFIKSAFRTARSAFARSRVSIRVSIERAGRVFERRYRLITVESSLPRVLKRHYLYVLTESGAPWQAALVCPCGCKEVLELNLLPDERPRWRYGVDSKGFASVEPSINRRIGCRSHFFLRSGRIVWAK